MTKKILFLGNRTQFVEVLEEMGYEVKIIDKHEQIEKCDLCLVIGYYKIIPKKYLKIPKLILGFHASALPKGKGHAPLNYPLLHNESELGVTLFKLTNKLDSGPIYDQRFVKIEKYDTYYDLVKKVNKKIEKMIREDIGLIFSKNTVYKLRPTSQEGVSTYYEKRTPKDSEIDTKKTVDELFNLLRACNNEKYPPFFYKYGRKFYLRLEGDDR